MSDSSRIDGTSGTQHPKRKHDLGEEKGISRKKKKKCSFSESEDSADSSLSSSMSSSSDSSSSSSESCNVKRKKTKKKKEKDSKKMKKRRKKMKLIQKKLKKKMKKFKKIAKSKLSLKEDENDVVGPVPLDDQEVPKVVEVPDRSKIMAPMTKEEWEKKQSVVRKVFDEATGRHRLIKGDGEVLEEIVSRQRHQEINQQATQGDGTSFQTELAVRLGKKK